jgi:hypothetical protein
MRKSEEGKSMSKAVVTEGKMLWRSVLQRMAARSAMLAVDDSGMSTVEYAIGTIAAAAFGAILYSVVTGDSIIGALTNIINRALTTRV